MKTNILTVFCLLFVISTNITHAIQLQDNEIISGIEADTNEVVWGEAESVDDVSIKMQSLYIDWRIEMQHCLSLMDRANEYICPNLEKELNDRKYIYEIAFPGTEIDTVFFSYEIILEHYLMEEMNIIPSFSQVDAAFNYYVSRFPHDNHPERIDILPIINSRALFMMDTVKTLASESDEIQKIERQDKLAEILEPWTADEMAIDADSNLCLVRNPDNNNCVVSVKEFNTFALIEPVPRWNSLDEARDWLLRELLKRKFVINQMNLKEIRLNDDLVEKCKNNLEYQLINKWHNFNARFDKQLLSDTYDRYFDRFFSERQIQKLYIIGSTDSLYIDSLYTEVLHIESDTCSNNRSKKITKLKAFPWISALSDNLPDTIASSIKSLKSQQYKKVSTLFGYFLVRVNARKRRPTIHMEPAMNKLTYIISKELELYGGKPDSIRALVFYRKNVKQFKTPDTIATRAWLVPLIDSSTFSSLSKTERQNRISKDTASFSSMYKKSFELPQEVASQLLKQIKKNNYKKGLIGPFSTTMGSWYFSVQNTTSGGKTIPFTQVKERIVNDLEIQSFPFETIAKTETGKKLLVQEALRTDYSISLPEKIESLSDEKIKKLIANKTINITLKGDRKIDDEVLRYARRKLYEKVLDKDRRNAEAWFNALDVDRTLLFKGVSQYVNK